MDQSCNLCGKLPKSSNDLKKFRHIIKETEKWQKIISLFSKFKSEPKIRVCRPCFDKVNTIINWETRTNLIVKEFSTYINRTQNVLTPKRCTKQTYPTTSPKQFKKTTSSTANVQIYSKISGRTHDVTSL
ncbi:unnamed protein product [Owenia fusiformis]|uniref:Uncharacterized protein n=1 Tax=Owenia fusiformis TaxID=6347 RepID=A0A8S4NPS4_OWEFU|nr:unnamed protein product [Owenia fusiformis]